MAMDAHTGSEQFKPGTQARGSALSMASKGRASNVTRACLRPSFAKDGHGLYVNVVCGKISGQLYPDS